MTVLRCGEGAFIGPVCSALPEADEIQMWPAAPRAAPLFVCVDALRCLGFELRDIQLM